MIEIDLIKKHGKKALGMSEQAHAPRTWRGRFGEILLEIAIIVFAITLSIWLHSWQEHRHSRARERQFLVGLRQDLGHDIAEMRDDSALYVNQIRGMRYFRTLSTATLNKDSLRQHGGVLGSKIYFLPNSSRFEGLKSSGSLGILESDTLLSQILTYYERTANGLAISSKEFGELKNRITVPILAEQLDADRGNLVEVMQQRPMQNVMGVSMVGNVRVVLTTYHATAQEARQLRRTIDEYLKE